jgi:hypothetical protein
MAYKSMTATVASYPSVPTWAMNHFAADNSDLQQESWNLFLNALTFMS